MEVVEKACQVMTILMMSFNSEGNQRPSQITTNAFCESAQSSVEKEETICHLR